MLHQHMSVTVRHRIAYDNEKTFEKIVRDVSISQIFKKANIVTGHLS